MFGWLVGCLAGSSVACLVGGLMGFSADSISGWPIGLEGYRLSGCVGAVLQVVTCAR